MAQCMNINRGNQFVRLVSMGSQSRGLQLFAEEAFGADSPQARQHYALSDVVTTLIQTAEGQTITITHNTDSPHPYSRDILVQGTKGLVRKYPEEKIHIEGRTKGHDWESLDAYREEYEHPLWKAMTERSKGAGHGGMDFIEDCRLIQCLAHGNAHRLGRVRRGGVERGFGLERTAPSPRRASRSISPISPAATGRTGRRWGSFPDKMATRDFRTRAAPPVRGALCANLFFQHHVVAAVEELDTRHEGPHQHHAAAAGAGKVGGIGRVGQLAGIETGALVGDFHPDLLRRKRAAKMDVFGLGSIRVAVYDGVDQRLIDRQVDAEDVVAAPTQRL